MTSFGHNTSYQLFPMKLFSFVQFRIPAGKVTDIFEKPFDAAAILDNQSFIEALKDATPDFWKTVTTEKSTEEHQKTLYKYYSRWCTRCTPFGRFSGVFTADLSGKTSFPETIPRQYTEPDILEKKRITGLLNDTDLRKADFRVNSSLYTRAGKHYLLQFIEENTPYRSQIPNLPFPANLTRRAVNGSTSSFTWVRKRPITCSGKRSGRLYTL